MGVLDPNTQEVDDLAYAADNHEVASTNTSFLDGAIDAVTKGGPLTALSIVNSFANTAIDVANFFGASMERYDPEIQLADNSDLLEYYKDHKLGIETAGLAIGSFVPGMIAVKAYKLAAYGRAGANIARATGIQAGLAQKTVQGAVAEIEAGNASLNGQINAEKFKAIAQGFGEQAIQSTVWELATLGTMHASPLLDNLSFKDTMDNMAYGVLLGGGIGGVLEGIGTRAIINKALVTQDRLEKTNEMATYLGRGGYLAGDKVVTLLNSLDNIPTAITESGARKAAETRSNALLAAKKTLLNITADPNDNALSNAFMDTLLKMKNEGNLSKEDMFEYLGGLSRISRVGTTPEVQSSDIFYLNKFASTDKADWSMLVTAKPTEDAAASLGYRLKPYSTDVKIARYNDTVKWDAASASKFSSKEDAFAQGYDLYIDKQLQIHASPISDNLERVARPGELRPLTAVEEASYRETGKLPARSEQFLGAPLKLNVLDGTVKSTVYPVVGDLVRPEDLKLVHNSDGAIIGLQIGKDKVSQQRVGSGFAFGSLDNIDANARYVWANMRGIKNGDAIHYNDVPMLEQVYREANNSADSFEDAVKEMHKNNVRLVNEAGDKIEMPTDRNGLLGLIQSSKDQIIKEMVMGDNAIKDVADVASRANVPLSYIEGGLKGVKADDYMVPVEQHMKLNHVQLEYDIGNINQQDGQILRGMLDVQYRIQVIKDALYSAATDFFKENTEDFISKGTAADADIFGVGSKAFSASNSGYGTLGQDMEVIGKNSTQEIQKRRSIVSDRLSSAHQAVLSDPASSAELGTMQNVLQRTGERYVLLTKDEADKFKVPFGTVVLRGATRIEDGVVTQYNPAFLPQGFISGEKAALGKEGKYSYYQLGEKTTNYLLEHVALNDDRLDAINKFYAASGITKSIDPRSLYVPPVDTSKYKFVALVRKPRGLGMADDAVAAITGETAKDLEQKVAALKGDYEIYYKDTSRKYHEVLGDYEYGLNFAQQEVNSTLSKRGILADVFPDTRGETILQRFTDWHYKQETRLVRNYVELANSQLFAELRAMGERFVSPETSKVGFLPSVFGKTTENPYNSYIKTALGISNREEYRLWNDANEKLEAFFGTAFKTARSTFQAAHSGLLSYEEASQITQKFGLGNPYAASVDALKTYYDVANKLPPDRYLSRFVGAANSILSGTAIRLDFFQSLINIVSTPVLLLAEANSASAAVRKLMTTELPDGSGRSIPAVSKLLYSAVGNYFSSAREGLIAQYRKLGVVRGLSSDYFQMIDELTLPMSGIASAKDISQRISRAADIGAKLTGSNFSEEFARFIAADVGRQIFEAAGHSGRELTDNMTTFVNRVHGNYVASQRPVAFQGPIGQAVGLFQTYQFNLMQQLFRHVENRDAKTLGVLFGMQATLFGMQGLPGFQAINNHIIGNAAGNPAHNDLYSIIPTGVDKKVGDYLLYGVLSNWLNTGLYSRGDINPRQITILPTNPLDYPAISGGIRFLSSVLDSASKVANGGNIVQSFLTGLEHNGLSRPLTGLAQMVQGYTTTSKGSLVSSTRPSWENLSGAIDLFSAANFGRLLGARPLDEAVAMDAMYRKTLYQAKDSARIQEMGSAVKTTLYAGGSPDEDQMTNFVAKYASSGGNIQNFGQKMIEWSRDANASVANQVYRSLKSPLNQNMMKIMGGQPLPDFQSLPSTEPKQ